MSGGVGMVFPGQGSQKVGMLAELAAQHKEVEAAFAEASEVVGEDLWQMAQADPDGLLNQTRFTQPVLLAASVAVWRLWQALGGPAPVLLAGHSLGEYSALVCGGVLDYQEAVGLVHHRGKYMQEAVPAGEGKMAAIVGLEDSQIHALCAEAAGTGASANSDRKDEVVSPSNFNSPGQTVIAGSAAAVERAIELCKQAGAKRAMPLQVSVPSHCALMRPAAERLAAELAAVKFAEPSVPVIQNVSGKAETAPDRIRENLVRQLYEPVQWVETVRTMAGVGVRLAVECGPGKVLCGLIKRTEPGLACCGSDSPESVEYAIAEAKGGGA